MKLGLSVVVVLFVLSQSHAGISAQPMPFTETIQHFEERAAQVLASGDFVRPGEEHAYTIDMSQLMLYFALAGDEDAYRQMREIVLENVFINSPDETFTQGFVAWRYNPDPQVPLDASGTTEALRVAEALWRGAQNFDSARDAATSVFILDGYARHAYVDQGIWLIRNYYNLGTRAFANNTFMVDYHPDFVQEVAESQGSESLAEVAQNSYALYEQAISPSGLFYDLVQPEIKTLVPDLPIVAFSPNDIIQLSNSCTVAETVVEGRPEMARLTLDFALARADDLYKYFNGTTGEAIPGVEVRAGLPEYNCLVRLAARLGDEDALAVFLPMAQQNWDALRTSQTISFYDLGETLLALHYITNR